MCDIVCLAAAALNSLEKEKKKVMVKVGMVGDSQIGKTSLMVKYVEGKFQVCHLFHFVEGRRKGCECGESINFLFLILSLVTHSSFMHSFA